MTERDPNTRDSHGRAETPDLDAVTTRLPAYSDVLTSLDGCSSALARLMDAVRGLFDSAGRKDGYDEAVTELRDAHSAALDWCAREAKRHA